jgi:hypothetical protein
VSDLDVTVGVDTAAAEEGLRRLSANFHREIQSIDRSKAEAKIGADITALNREVAKAKRELLELEKLQADPDVDLDTKQFDAEVAAVKMRLKELGTRKAEIQVDASQLRDANREMAISAKRQEAMAKQSEKLDRARERGVRTSEREAVQLRRNSVAVHKLREAYAKLAAEEDQLANRTGRPGGILRSAAENRRLELVRANLAATREEIEKLGGTIVDIDPEMERQGGHLARWIDALGDVRLHMGFFSASLKQTGIGLVLLGPLLTAVLGSATSLVGVLGTALAGALAVSAAGFAGFALAAGGAFAVIKPIVGELEAATKASEAYHDAVLKYGKGSKEAKTAQEKLKQTLAGISPEARKAIRSWGGVRKEWAELTKTAREPVFEAAGEGIKTLRSLMPSFARETVATTRVLSDGWNEAMEAIRGKGFRSGLQTVMQNFRKGLPSLLDGFGSLATILGRITVSVSRFIPGLNRGFETWAENLMHSVGAGATLDQKIGRLIAHMREFGHFSQATGRLIVALFNTSADSGAGLLKTLTDLFNRWADWMNTVEGKRSLKRFFAEAADETRALFALLGRLVQFLFEFSRAVAPVSDAFVGLLRIVGNVVDALSDITAVNTALEVTAKILVGMWAVNRVQAFATAVAAAARSLGLLSAAQAASGATAAGSAAATRGALTGAATAGAAGGAATGGLRGVLGSIRWARVGAVGAGVALFDQVAKGFEDRAAERSPNLMENLGARLKTSTDDFVSDPVDTIFGGGAQEFAQGQVVLAVLGRMQEARVKINRELEQTLVKQAESLDQGSRERQQLEQVIALIRRGRELKIRVGSETDPKALARLLSGYRILRSGALASLGDIGKITRENTRLIQTVLPRGSEEARQKTAENFRAAADAIKKAMENGTISVRTGTAKMRDLLRNARLLEGRDPLGLARGFAESWRVAGAIHRQSREKVIDDLRKMPPRAREEAFRFMLAFGRGLVRGKKIPEEDLRLFKSRALTELRGIGGGFNGLSGVVYMTLSNIGDNLYSALKNMGVGKPTKFNLNKLVGMLPKVSELPPLDQKQQGGFTVSGSGSGDKKLHALPRGSFVMNREASSTFELNRGGPVMTLLEPKERVFLPQEVDRIGAGNLRAMNEAVPRQRGGGIGPEPRIAGPAGQARDVGQGAIRRAHEAAKDFFDKQAAKFGGPGGPLGSAPGALGAVERLAAAMGLGVTSGYRPGDTDSYHGQNRARDFADGPAGMMRFAQATAARWGSRLLELIYSPLGWSIDNGRRVAPYAVADHYDHVHVAMQMGGLLKLLSGGSVEEWDKLSGSHWDNDELATLAHLVGMANPGYMAQKGQGESSGQRKAVGHDRPGVEGLGLWQITTGVGNEDIISKWGGRNAMFHPYLNARAAEEIQEDNPGAWFAPPRGPLGRVQAGLAQQMRSIVSGGSAGGGSAGKVPDTVKATYHTYHNTPGGGLVGIQHKDVPVKVEIPDFGAIPDTEKGIKKELRQLEHVMLPQYRAAFRQTKRKDTKEKLKESLRKIEARIRELRTALREMRYAKARKRTQKRHERQLGRITGHESLIEAARREYEELNQNAEQTVALEPEQPGELTHDWIDKTLEPYIQHQETPAYEAVLNSEARWRNTILTAQDAATQITKGWEAQIGYPQKGRQPWLENPDLQFPPQPKNGSPTALAKWIYGLHDQIKRIQDFASSRSPKWWQEHPKARERRDNELEMVKTYFRPELQHSQWRRGSLISVLGEGRESFNWARGTGSFEEALVEVQGIHWPRQHEKLPTLPSYPVAGMFGGAIWDTQEAIRQLGLKISQAKESITDTSAADRAAEIGAFEEAIRGLLAGRPFLRDTHRGPEPFMGAFQRGGVALVGEGGPELAHLPDGTRIHDAADTARLLEPDIVVDLSKINYGPWAGRQPSQDGARGDTIYHMTNHFSGPPPDPHTWAKQQRFELEAMT